MARSDRNRNARLASLCELVPATNAVVGIDLADPKQMVVACDHDWKVLTERTFRCRAWDLVGRWTGRLGAGSERVRFYRAISAVRP